MHVYSLSGLVAFLLLPSSSRFPSSAKLQSATLTAPFPSGSSISMSTILGKALRAEFSDTQLREPVLPTGALNRAERDKIEELFEAEQALMAPLNEDNMFVVSGADCSAGLVS